MVGKFSEMGKETVIIFKDSHAVVKKIDEVQILSNLGAFQHHQKYREML